MSLRVGWGGYLERSDTRNGHWSLRDQEIKIRSELFMNGLKPVNECAVLGKHLMK